MYTGAANWCGLQDRDDHGHWPGVPTRLALHAVIHGLPLGPEGPKPPLRRAGARRASFSGIRVTSLGLRPRLSGRLLPLSAGQHLSAAAAASFRATGAAGMSRIPRHWHDTMPQPECHGGPSAAAGGLACRRRPCPQSKL